MGKSVSLLRQTTYDGLNVWFGDLTTRLVGMSAPSDELEDTEMDVFAEFRETVLAALKQVDLPEGVKTDAVSAEPPRDASHGDVATNAAMVVAKQAKMKPREVAEKIAEILSGDVRIASVDVAGPGFINLRLSPEFWRSRIVAALEAGADYGRLNPENPSKINVEYVSANPTGPLHVGHTRGAVFGDALASLLEFAGHEVVREYYINDGGSQVDTLARSAYLRYQEAHGQDIEIAEGLYPGDYLVPVGEAMKETFGERFLDQPEEEWLPVVRDFATEKMMDLIRADLGSLGVVMDEFFSEKSLYGTGRIEEAVAALDKKGLIYQGVLEPPKGMKPEDWEPREQTLFKSTDYGDDVDRPIKKSDGSWTYFAPDIAYHYNKLQRADELINVFGADHSGYVKRMKAACKALGNGTDRLDIKLTQLVKLMRDGEEVKMSKRSNNFVLLSELIEEVGAGVVRFVMLTRKNDAPLDFDFSKALEQSKDNPVFYVQYAHARVCSLLRRARDEAGIEVPDDAVLAQADLSCLTHEADLALVSKIAEWPRQVRLAAEAHEPHRIAFYLYDLASAFHSLWNRGNADESLRFVQPDENAVTFARLALARSCALTIFNGLCILGVTPMQEMR